MEIVCKMFIDKNSVNDFEWNKNGYVIEKEKYTFYMNKSI